MKATLLLCAGLLTLFPAQLAAATPALDTASILAQTAVNPTSDVATLMDFDAVGQVLQPLNAANELLAERTPAAQKPTRPVYASIVLERGIAEAAEGSSQQDGSGRRLIDCEGFAVLFLKNVRSPESDLLYFAAIGWGLSEKRAASKLATLSKAPSLEGAQSAIVAILIGLSQELEDDRVDSEVLDHLDTARQATQAWEPLE